MPDNSLAGTAETMTAEDVASIERDHLSRCAIPNCCGCAEWRRILATYAECERLLQTLTDEQGAHKLTAETLTKAIRDRDNADKYRVERDKALKALAAAREDGARLERAFKMLDRLVENGTGTVEIGQTESDGRPGIFFPQNEMAHGVADTVKEALLHAYDAYCTDLNTARAPQGTEADNG